MEWGRKGWSWVRRGLSQKVGVGEVRGVREVEVEGLGEFGSRVGLKLGNSEGWGIGVKGVGVGGIGVS